MIYGSFVMKQISTNKMYIDYNILMFIINYYDHQATTYKKAKLIIIKN